MARIAASPYGSARVQRPIAERVHASPMDPACARSTIVSTIGRLWTFWGGKNYEGLVEAVDAYNRRNCSWMDDGIRVIGPRGRAGAGSTGSEGGNVLQERHHQHPEGTYTGRFSERDGRHGGLSWIGLRRLPSRSRYRQSGLGVRHSSQEDRAQNGGDGGLHQ